MSVRAQQQYSRYVSVPSDEGVRVDETITINRPVHEVYSFWRHLENLARFMRHIESVFVTDTLHSHWRVNTLGGKIVEWDAEVIEDRENEMISWRSIPGTEIDNAGSVWFTPAPGGGGTLVEVSLKYVPPAGRAGDLITKLFGRDAKSEIREDLQRVKAILETGQPPAEPITRMSRAAQAVDNCVRRNRWVAIACTAAGFFAFGFLLGRVSTELGRVRR